MRRPLILSRGREPVARAFKQHPDDRAWYAEWPLGRDAATGKHRYRRKAGFRTRKEAERYAQDQEAARLASDAPPSDLTVAAFLDRWLEEHARRRETRTYVYYQSYARLYLTDLLGRRRLQDVREPDIHAVYQAARSTVEEATVLKIHRMLKLVFRHAVVWGLLSRSPMDRVEAPRAKRSEQPAYSVEEVLRLLAAAEGTPAHAFLTLAAYTGLTVSELMGLQWRDIDGDTIRVQRSRHWVQGAIIVKGPKRANRARVAVLPGPALAVLSPARGIGEAWVFDTTVWRMYRWVREASRRAGLPGARVHALRHTFASLAFQGGATTAEVSAALGHASPYVTHTVYNHLLDGGQRAASAAVARQFAAISLSDARDTTVS